jgi:DNA-binding response OmpR family regulator
MSNGERSRILGKRSDLGEKARVLLIEEDQEMLVSLTTNLEEEGYYVDIAKNWKESVQMTREGIYDVALIDVKLSDMEKPRLLAELGDISPEMIKIMVTGQSSIRSAIEVVEKGINGYIVKPFPPDELLKIMEHHLRKQDEERQSDVNGTRGSCETILKRLNETSDRKRGEAVNLLPRIGIYSCLLCGCQFCAKRVLKRHYHEMHQDSIPEYAEKPTSHL